jgi:hypothetical protein
MKYEKGLIGYESGIPVVAATRKHHLDWTELRLFQCPYCGRRHVHGGKEGHRVAHCFSGNGYLLRVVTELDR